MKLGKKLLGLGMALVMSACADGSDVPKEYKWQIAAEGQRYFCKSYQIDGDTLTASGCYPGDGVLTIMGEFAVNSR